MGTGLEVFLEKFKPSFENYRHSVFSKICHYIEGLFKLEKGKANCSHISESLARYNHQSVNHLLSNSPWSYKSVLEALSYEMSEVHKQGEGEVALLFDEVGFRKKGNHSACVSRQYLGCIGKVDNGQVAVVGALAKGDIYSPIDVELFMPESWQEDQDRRKKAHIPPEIKHKTKPEMVLEKAKSLKKRGIHFDYLNFDSLYGSNLALMENLDKEGILFIGDTKGSLKVYTEKPVFKTVTKQEKQKGRPCIYPKAEQNRVSLSEYKQSLMPNDYQKIKVRKTTHGSLKAYFHQKKVWLCLDEKEGKTIELQLLIRKDLDGKIKYSFANMHTEDLKTLARRQAQRVFVERVFQEGKNEIGLADYQIRSWTGFHKHMTLCFLALAYISYQKVKLKSTILLTAQAAKKLVAANIYVIWNEPKEALKNIYKNLTHYQNTIKKAKEKDTS